MQCISDVPISGSKSERGEAKEEEDQWFGILKRISVSRN